MPFFVIKKGLVLLEWKYFPTPKILDPLKMVLCLKLVILIILVFAIPFKLSTMKVSFLNIVYGKDDAIWFKKLLNN